MQIASLLTTELQFELDQTYFRAHDLNHYTESLEEG